MKTVYLTAYSISSSCSLSCSDCQCSIFNSLSRSSFCVSAIWAIRSLCRSVTSKQSV
jgi:hypothetical protein